VKGWTLDTGALIALERRKKRIIDLWSRAIDDEVSITIPTIVLTEWWAGTGTHADVLRDIQESVTFEALDDRLAKIVAIARLKVASATLVDTVVAASAAQRGDAILTSDPQDMQRLRDHFKGIASIVGC